MYNTEDIRYIIGANLMNEGYIDLKEIPFEVLKKHITKYLQFKMQKRGEYLDLKELLEEFDRLVPEEEKQKTMGNLIFFLLECLSMIQGFEIIWSVEEDAVKPYLTMNLYEQDKYDRLVTNKNVDYRITFNTVFDAISEKLEKERKK